MRSIAEVLRNARETLDATDARLLLGHVIGQSSAWLIAHDDSLLSEPQWSSFSALCMRRQNGEPIAYLTGYREFYGRMFAVGPGVLIPRPETELLVDLAKFEIAAIVGAGRTAPRILDLGTGTGCIAISIALESGSAKPNILAIDASPAALTIAHNNAVRLNAPIRFIESNWFENIPDEYAGTVDLIVSNPPYIAAEDPHLKQGDLVYEPVTALSSGPDGLDAIRIIVHDAPRYLRPGGCLCLEHGYNQADAVHHLLEQHGYHAIQQQRDIAGIVRVTRSIWPGA